MMKTKTDSFAYYAFQEAEGEIVTPQEAVRVPFILSQRVDHQVLISVPAQDHGAVAEVLLEVHDGKLVAYVWDEKTIERDPAARVILLEDATDRTWKVED